MSKSIRYTDPQLKVCLVAPFSWRLLCILAQFEIIFVTRLITWLGERKMYSVVVFFGVLVVCYAQTPIPYRPPGIVVVFLAQLRRSNNYVRSIL